ncbi:MAG: TlpA disulfide reductase family protein [Candidatus Bipolaricaulota bacterium]
MREKKSETRRAFSTRAALAVVLAALGLSSAVAASDGEGPVLAPLFTLPNLDGCDVSLADYLGQVVIFEFWASWCHTCTESFPAIHDLQHTYAEQGVALLVLCFDKNEEDARLYLTDNGYQTSNVLWGSLDAVHAVRDLYEVAAVTHAIVIDREGYIRYSGHPAKLTADVLEPWL